MSFWRRLLGRREGEKEAPPSEAEPARGEAREQEKETPDGPVPEPSRSDPDARLAWIGSSEHPIEDGEVLELFDELRGKGREARAIDLARRVLARAPERVRIHLRVAELLAARGDDEGAEKLLLPFVDASPPLELWMLAAEIAERRGELGRALALYERVVARDLDFPRARARVARLREGRGRSADVGATLMADGALTRGRYRVERELGRGGAGTVFLADDLALGRKVALKVYHRRGRNERARLLVEARMPARIEHPGVVRVFDLDEPLAAIAMERVRGGSIRGELGKGGLALPRVLRWYVTASEALSAVHEARMVHRDIKPSNLLLREDDRVVLTDFGIAVEQGQGAGAGMEGTMAYMPTEQREGKPAQPSMDMYALGASLRETLGQLAGPAPEALAELAAVCMRSDPLARPTASWLAERLRALSAV